MEEHVSFSCTVLKTEVVLISEQFAESAIKSAYANIRDSFYQLLLNKRLEATVEDCLVQLRFAFEMFCPDTCVEYCNYDQAI